MRTYLIVTLARRGGECFQLKTPRQEVIGTMRLNGRMARHEMTLTEEQFLRHAKDLAKLCEIPGMGTYVAEISEDVTHLDGVITAGDVPCNGKCKPGDYDDACPAHGIGVNIVGNISESTVSIPGAVEDWKNGVEVLAESDDLKGKPFFALCKIARASGINPAGMTNDQLRDAIRRVRQVTA